MSIVNQYTVSEAYSYNSTITKYQNGKKEWCDVVSWHELDGYTNALSTMGITRAYDINEYAKKLIEAKRDLKIAEEEYEKAKKHMIYGQKEPDLEKLEKELYPEY